MGKRVTLKLDFGREKKSGEYFGRIKHTVKWQGDQMCYVKWDGNKGYSVVPYHDLEFVSPEGQPQPKDRP